MVLLQCEIVCNWNPAGFCQRAHVTLETTIIHVKNIHVHSFSCKNQNDKVVDLKGDKKKETLP